MPFPIRWSRVSPASAIPSPGASSARRDGRRSWLGAGFDALLAASMVGPEGRVIGDRHDAARCCEKARRNAATARPGQCRVSRGLPRRAAPPGRHRRRRDLQRRHQPLPGQGRRAGRGVPRAQARWADADRRHRRGEGGAGGRAKRTSRSGPAELPVLSWKESCATCSRQPDSRRSSFPPTATTRSPTRRPPPAPRSLARRVSISARVKPR